MLVLPNYINSPLVMAAAIAVPPTATFGDMTTAAASRVQGVNAYRLVSWGMRLKNVVAPLNASGMVHVRALSNREGFALDILNMSSYSRSEALDIPLQDCKDVHIVGARTDQRPADWYPAAYNPPSIAVPAWLASGFAPVSVYVSGVPNSISILDVEILFHFELQFDDGSDLGLLTTPAPIPNPLVVSAVSSVQSAAKHFFNQAAHTVGLMLERRAAQALGSLIGGPVGAIGAGMLALTVD